MGKKRAKKQEQDAGSGGGGLSSITTHEQASRLLAQWTAREIQVKLQCSPEDAQQAAACLLSMTTKQVREWCNDLLSETEKRIDEDRRFYNMFLDKKEELGLLNPNKPPPADAMSDTLSVTSSASTATAKGGKRKYNKKLDLAKAQDGLDAVIPVLRECNCEATKHKLLTNCQLCGKIICEQEGWGRCFFCGADVSKEAKPIRTKSDVDDEAYLARQREFLKAVAQRDKLIKFQDERSKRTTIVDDQEDYFESSNPWLDPKEQAAALEKEKKAKAERLERHRKGGAFQIHLDFINKEIVAVQKGGNDKAKEEAKEEEEEKKEEEKEKEEEDPAEENASNIMVEHNAYNPLPVTLEDVSSEDEEGNRVVGIRVMRNPDAKGISFDRTATLESWCCQRLEEEGISAEKAKKYTRSLIRMTSQAAVRGWVRDHLNEDSTFAEDFQAESERIESLPQPVQPSSGKQEVRQSKGRGRLQTDFEELDETVAKPVETMVSKLARKKPWVYVNTAKAAKLDAMSKVVESNSCMSMHQPWASLLVCGIKKHEGRTWGTSFKGRLWIHAAAHEPTAEDIQHVENFYADRGATVFPTHYPTSVLLGCVTVTDVLSYEDYTKKIPKKDQESTSEHVFICSNPQLLVLPLPMNGRHKIFQLEKTIHEAAKRQAGGRSGI